MRPVAAITIMAVLGAIAFFRGSLIALGQVSVEPVPEHTMIVAWYDDKGTDMYLWHYKLSLGSEIEERQGTLYIDGRPEIAEFTGWDYYPYQSINIEIDPNNFAPSGFPAIKPMTMASLGLQTYTALEKAEVVARMAFDPYAEIEALKARVEALEATVKL